MFDSDSQFRLFQPFQPSWPIALIGVILLGATSVTPATASHPARSQTEISQAQETIQSARPPRSVVRRVRRDLAQRLNRSPQELRMVSFSRETWPDSCLGLAAPNERCAMALVEGWRIELTDGQQNWVYRTDLTAEVLRLETPAASVGLPPDITDRLFQQIAQETGAAASSLKVVAVKQSVWDGCMGIFEPGQACTKIALPGWQVIVSGEQQSWVYHVSEDGRIVQNSTASGSQADLVPSFMTDESALDSHGATLVFRWMETGGLAGMVSEKFLMSDGTIYRRSSQFHTEPMTEPVVEKRLTPQQVEQFQQMLIAQKFQNLNGLRYVSAASLADYPTTTVQALGTIVQYTDLELGNFPPALQTVIQTWEKLSGRSPDR